MRNSEIHPFIKKLVEPGTEKRFTLLTDKKHLRKSQTIQQLMKQSIFVKHKLMNINTKVCKTCLFIEVGSTFDRLLVMSDSLHNTQTI